MLGCALLGLAACSPEIDRIHEVDTVRVLAVQKTVNRGGLEPTGAAYARPGERVQFHMLWDRGSRNQAAGIDVERLWIKGCINPKGDSYIGCADLFVQAAQDPAGFVERNVIKLPKAPRPTIFDTIEVEMPGADVFRQPDDAELPPYALYILFFAACAGEIGVSGENVSIVDGRLPVTCTRDGEQLGADDFVVGYTQVYVYEKEVNDNPHIDGIFFDQIGWAIPVNRSTDITQIFGTTCGGVGCLAVPDPVEADIPSLCAQGLCVAACPDDGDIDKCPPHWLAPAINSALPPNQEPDTVSKKKNDVETLAVHYHADRGTMRSDVRVIRDGTGQWNPDFGANYYAPKEPGFARVWVVVRDNRGGVDWVSTPVVVQ